MRRGGGLGRIRVLAATLAALFLLALLPTLAVAAVDPEYLGAFGPDGTEGSSFEEPAAIAVDEGTGAIFVGDRKKQVLYKFDSEGNPLAWGGSDPNISENEISGLSFGVLNQAAVDPETHVLYVTSDNKVRAFEPNGEPHEFTAGPGEGSSEIPGAVKLNSVAVDAQGNIYAGDSGPTLDTPEIRVYSRSGALLTEFIPSNDHAPIAPKALSVSPDGSLYVANDRFDTYAYKLEPSQFPLTASTTFGFGELLSKIYVMSVAVDPTTSHVYVGGFEEGHSRLEVYNEDDKPVGTLGGLGEEGEFKGNAPGTAVNGGSERVYALDAEGSTVPGQVKVFETFTFPVVAPTVTATSVIDLNLFTANLRAQINPNMLETTYHFEYGTEDCSVSACTSTPGGTIAPAHKPVAVSPQEISGLQPGTTYHYRVVAENAKGTTEGPDKTFTTPRSGLGFGLADSRAWEMVSPSNKSGGKIVHGNLGVMQAAADGNGLAYQTITSIEPNPDGNRAIDTSTVLSRRGAGGAWSFKDITPPQTEITPFRFGGVYKVFSPNLGSALLEPQDNTPLSIEASEETPYLRDNTEPGTYRPLVTAKEGYANVPPGTKFGGHAGSGNSLVMVQAANSDLTHVVLTSREPLVAGAAPGSLYEWSEGQLQPVSVLPPAEGGGVVQGIAGTRYGSVHHAISEDGSRVFWSIGDYASTNGLYVRDTEGQQTGRLDVPQAGAPGAGEPNPHFRAASADGSVVFFTDSRQLTADASEPGVAIRDLYRCEVGTLEGGELGCNSLVDLSRPREGSGEMAEVLGMTPGSSEDGERIYFIAKGVLDTTPNEFGDSAAAGGPNLYLWEEEVGTHFIATLSARDYADWGTAFGGLSPFGHASVLSAAASPDGRYLAFMTENPITGYDNRDAKSEEPVEEVYRYDAGEERLDCISCNPSGASPQGEVSDPSGNDPGEVDPHSSWSQRWVAAILPAPQESAPTDGLAFHRPRVVLDNGRVFFNAIDALVSADSNGEWDVYQYEPTGVGDCTSASEGAAIARSAGGCVSLISSGTSEEEASFIDASESGDDVFFLTPARLSATDEDFELDVYDARVDGIPATLPVINECLGEACQPPPNPPNDPTPASAAFHGSGNVPSERCPQSKRKVIRAGSAKCVAKKHKKKKHSRKARKAKRAASSRRAGR
jgi:sugar lactone lactonase YvrE